MKYENNPTNVSYILELAKQAHVLQKYDEAVELWLKLLALIENNENSTYYIETAKSSIGEPVQEIYAQLSAAYLLMERYEEALKAAQKAMQSKNILKEYVHIYAHCEIIAGSLDKALSALEEMRKETPDYPPALLFEAVIFALKGRKKEAREFIESLVQNHVQITSILNTLARQLFDYGKKKEARVVLSAITENKVGDEETAKLFNELQMNDSE